MKAAFARLTQSDQMAGGGLQGPKVDDRKDDNAL